MADSADADLTRDTLVTDGPPKARVRLAAVGDLHVAKGSGSRIETLLGSVHDRADVLVLCGDLTDHGTVEEAHLLARELAHIRVPKVAVLGNHDHEAGCPERVTEILAEADVAMLDGESCEVHGVGFAGIKGFLGGFGRSTLGFWGEKAVKAFVQAAIDESLLLENALAHLKTEKTVVLMHYAPIEATCEGERREIFPYLGCSRLEEPMMRAPVDVVFHGHAHKGAVHGRTQSGIPVFNVAMPLLVGNGSPLPYLLYEL